MQRDPHQVRYALVALWLMSSSGCDLPKDSHGTLERIEGDEIRAGAAGEIAALEDERAWLEALAASHDANLVLHQGETHELIDRLRRGEIDLLVALPAQTPFKKDVGLSQPYDNRRLSPSKRVWAVRPGENAWLYEVDRALLRHAGR